MLPLPGSGSAGTGRRTTLPIVLRRGTLSGIAPIVGIVTLILGMSKADGIYLSVDYRVTNSRTGRLIDDASVKHLQVAFPPHATGPRALLAYTGLAILPDGTQTGRWIRETLRGESEVVNASMAHLRDRLERDIARLRQPLIINVFVVEEGGRRLFGGFSNVRKPFLSTECTSSPSLWHSPMGRLLHASSRIAT